MQIDFIIIQLSNCSIFKRISENRIKELLEKYPYRLLNFSKGEQILSKGEQMNALRIVVEGSASAVMNDDFGKTLKVDDLHVGQSLAPAFLFTSNQSYPVDVYAKTDCRLLSIDKLIVLQLFAEEQKILENYLGMVSSIVQMLTKKVRVLTLKTLKAKLAFMLINEFKQNQSMVINFGRQEMADFLGVERPSLSRVLGQMCQDGLINIEGKSIHINNPKDLQKLIP